MQNLQIIDSHCHLTFPSLFDDLNAVLLRASAAGVVGFINVCTKYSEIEKLKQISCQHSNILYSVGIHPSFAATQECALADVLKTVLSVPDAIAVGEVGLDKSDGDSDLEAQKSCFREHIEASISANKPLIVHTRDAEPETLAILNEYNGRCRGVIHCFSGDVGFARMVLNLGFYVSFSGILTYKKNEFLREAARFIPEDRILIETDAPFLSPDSKRGKTCEPAFVAETLNVLASVRGADMLKLNFRIKENFNNLFTYSY